MLKQLLDQEWY